MIFPRETNPVLCAAKEAGRYSIEGVALSFFGGRPFLVATDGRMLVAIPVIAEDGEQLGEVTKILPKEAIAMARKAANSSRTGEARLELNGSIEVRTREGGMCTFPYIEDQRFPEWQSIPPKVLPVASVCFDAERLATLQRSMGARCIRLCVHGLTDDGQVDDMLPLTVQPVDLGDGVPAPEAFAILMAVKEDK